MLTAQEFLSKPAIPLKIEKIYIYEEKRDKEG